MKIHCFPRFHEFFHACNALGIVAASSTAGAASRQIVHLMSILHVKPVVMHLNKDGEGLGTSEKLYTPQFFSVLG